MRMTVTVRKNNFGREARRIASRMPVIISTTALQLEAYAKSAAPFDTGHLRNSITTQAITPIHYRVTAGAHYSAYVEFGTRFMDPQPYFIPAVERSTALMRAAIGAAA